MSDQAMRERLFSTCEQAITQGVAPGLVALIQRDGGQLYHEAHGRRASVDAGGSASEWVSAPLRRDDIFDLASLTKVLCTTILTAQLVEQGDWCLDAPLPAPCDRPTSETTLADVLAHCSGFCAHQPFYTEYAWPSEQSRDSLLHRVLETPAQYPRKSKAVYSDLGFITLGAAMEWHYGQRLDRIFEDRIARPLGLDGNDEHWVGFLPLDVPSATMTPGLDGRVLPSEVYRNPESASASEGDYHQLRYRWAGPEHWARGQVHDDNAYCMLGVAGHAGLFGTAAGVAQIANAWLAGGPLGLSQETLQRFETKVPGLDASSTRCLGWDGVAQDSPLSPNAFCHLGYTGTGLWIERDRVNAVYVLLSHRVHKGRQDPTAIRALRRSVCEQGHAWAFV